MILSELNDNEVIMNIGGHVSKCGDLNKQRILAQESGWGCVQTNFGSTQMYGIPPDVLEKRTEFDCKVFWSWHSPYTLTMNPGNPESASDFLKQIIRLAGKWGIDCIVVHTGKAVGVPVDVVIAAILEYIEEYRIVESLEKANTRIAIEFGASTSGLNIYPGKLIRALAPYSGMIGYCLDLAHYPAAGTPQEYIMEVVSTTPPLVAHINYCGAVAGSSQDLHGWRAVPHLAKRKKEFFLRDEETTQIVSSNHDAMVRLLSSKGTPMVVEGSGFPQGDLFSEIKFVRQILESR